MDVRREVMNVLDEVLSLGGRTRAWSDASPLLGAVPELDSMAVANLLTALEDRFGFVIDDDEIDGATFSTVGTLVGFVQAKAGG